MIASLCERRTSTSFCLPSLLRSAAMAVSLLASSVLPRCRCSLCLVNRHLLSETDSYSSILYRKKVRSHGARAGCIRNLRVGPLPKRYRQIYIVALAQTRPPHYTITCSCLASRSAITHMYHSSSSVLLTKKTPNVAKKHNEKYQNRNSPNSQHRYRQAIGMIA